MADLVGDGNLNAQEYELIVTRIAQALDCVYLQNGIATGKHSARIKPLTESSTRPVKYLLPTLPHSLGLCPVGEDITLICMANMSARTFWEYVVERLGLGNTHLPTSSSATLTVRPRETSTLQQLDLSIFCDARIVIGYCTKPDDFNLQNEFQIRASAAGGSHNIARLCDEQALAYEVSTKLEEEGSEENLVQNFSSGYLQLHQWAVAHGLLSSEFNMLSVECLSTLYSTFICQQSTDMIVDTGSLMKSFFTKLQQVFDNRITQNPVKVLTPNSRNLADHIEPENVQAIRDEIGRVLDLYTASTEPHLHHSTDDGLRGFSTMYDFYIKMETRCWNPKNRPSVYASIPHILLALQTKVRRSSNGAMLARIWPNALISISEEDDSNRHYLLGISSDESKETSSERELLDSVLSGFVGSLKYDRESALISHALLTSSDLLTLLPSLSHHCVSQNPRSAKPHSPSKTSSAKFRTAAATMNRLRWDPHHAAIDYEIGYVDRFEDDLVWKPLENWERHTEDEEFVPEHRIQKIRRKEDGSLVWDRGARWDGTGGG